MELEIVKNCKKHGELKKSDVYKSKDPKLEAGYCYKCKQCVYEAAINKLCPVHGKITVEQRKSNGRCKLCHRHSANTKRDNNREWFNEKQNKDRVNNPEKWDDIYKRAYVNKKLKYGEILNDAEKSRRRGITLDQYYLMIERQNNKCAICKESETRKHTRGGEEMANLCIDHCHISGKLRELLCHNCNTGLGKFKDSIDMLKKAIEYLKKHQ